MSGYWNRDLDAPFAAYCANHLPVVRPPYWRAITERRDDAPHSLVDYLRQCYGGRENLTAYLRDESPYGTREDVRDHARRMSALATPDGYAYTPYTVGAPCAICGADC